MAQAAIEGEGGAALDLKHPLNVGSQEFADHKYAIYAWLREQAPVYRARVSVLKIYLLSRYDDCVALLKDPRFVRDRSTATGGRRMPFPMPRSASLLAQSMILEDEPEHQRLRGLVNSAFKPRAIARIEERIERLTHELLDEAEKRGRVDLLSAYCLPIPATVIRELVGVPEEDMRRFGGLMNTVSRGMSGATLFRAFFWELPKAARFMRELIERKRRDPQDDILTGLIQAEENGERLAEDELVSLVFLLVVAGFETTVHGIANGVLALLQHPAQLERLRDEPEKMDSAVEEILRYCGPIHGTKMNYATQDVTLHGVTIPKGAPVIPLLGAANHDPRAFESPEVFDIARTPNRHLGFGHGPHFCLGAQLARMETRLALKALLERNPNLRLAVEPERLELQNLPFWHRHRSLPVILG
jgi:cytochrome P450